MARMMIHDENWEEQIPKHLAHYLHHRFRAEEKTGVMDMSLEAMFERTMAIFNKLQDDTMNEMVRLSERDSREKGKFN